jgi:DNA replication protein DnaC
MPQGNDKKRMLPLSKFPTSSIDKQSFIVINGKPNSGKTLMAVSISRALKDKVDSVLLVTESASTIKRFGPHIPKTSYVHVIQNKSDTDPDMINQMTWAETEDFMMKWCANVRKRYTQKMDETGVSSMKPALLILDDIAGTKARLNCGFMRTLYSTYRQMGILPILITQDFDQMPSDTKAMMSHVFTYRLESKADSDKMQKMHFGMVYPPQLFYDVMISATGAPKSFRKAVKEKNLSKAEETQMLAKGPKMCLVKDNALSTSARKYNECVFWCMADINDVTDKWRIGNPIYFDIAEKLYLSPAEKAKRVEEETRKRKAAEELNPPLEEPQTVTKRGRGGGRPKRKAAEEAAAKRKNDDADEDSEGDAEKPATKKKKSDDDSDDDFILDD